MNAQELPAVVTALTGLLVVLGGAAAWLINLVNRKLEEAAKSAVVAQGEMRQHLEGEIADLKLRVSVLVNREGIYLKRVLQLEAFIQGQKGLVMPTLDGWPPR
jgi:phosphoribosyl-ATP pyrophosphohydrolase